METERPMSLAICLSGRRFFTRQLRNAVAKLARMSHWNFDFLATAKINARFAVQGSHGLDSVPFRNGLRK